MAYTPQRSWSTGDTISASDLNTYLRDNSDDLDARVSGLVFSGCTLSRAAATSIGDATWTAISWSAERKDTGGWYSSGTNIVVPSGAIPAGYTEIAVRMEARTLFASNATGSRRLRLLKNGTPFRSPTVGAITGDPTEIFANGVEYVSAADILTVELYQNSGGALNASETIVDVYRLGPVA